MQNALGTQIGSATRNPTPARYLTWTGATWAVSSGRAYNTPTLGSELLTDGGLENWTSATNATSWLETISGTSTVNQETSIVRTGSNAVRLDVDASGSNVNIRQVVTASVGNWLYYTAYLRSSAASGKTCRMDITNAFPTTSAQMALTNTYTQFAHCARATTTGPIPNILRQSTSVSHSIYGDDASIKVAALSTLIASVAAASSGVTVAARIEALTNSVPAGVVANLDSAGSPENFLIAYHDGAAVRLDKCVAGTYTNLIAVSVGFTAGANLEIRRVTGNDYQLWYYDVQRGTTQTVSDAGIISNTRYGLFSTYSGNTFSSFVLGGNLIPFAFP